MYEGFFFFFYEGYVDFPICIHVADIGPENIGYSNGITADGLPFEAEIYSYGKEENEQKELAIIIPDIYVEEDDCEDMEDAPVETSNIEGFKYEVQMQNYSVLPIGMVDRGQEENFKILQWYLNYIEETGLVQFTGNLRSCSVFYYTDVNGNDLVQIRTGLITDGRVEATTGLSFRDFPYREKSKNKNFLRVVK